MKRRFCNIVRLFCISIMAGLISMCFFVNVQASEEIEILYDSQKKTFIHGKVESHTLNFTGVMPGDLLEKTFSVGNSGQGSNPVRLYFRLKKYDKTEGALLTRCHMNFSSDDGIVLYDNEDPDKSVEDEWIFLGQFQPGKLVKLGLSVDVPIELGNEYMNQEAKLVFDFMAEEEDKTPEEGDRDDSHDIQTKPGRTGDETGLVLWTVIAGAAMISGEIVLYLRKKQY